MSDAKHTPGPWRWELNEKHKQIHLVGGKPQYDLTIIQPTRWGLQNATFLIRDTAHDGMNIMHKLHERRDWIAPFKGRAHHADWCAGITHPDMRLIATAPDLLEALKTLAAGLEWNIDNHPTVMNESDAEALEMAKEVIAKATGETA